MVLHAAASRYRMGEFIGGDSGTALRAEVRDWMTRQGVRNPDRMIAKIAPMPAGGGRRAKPVA